MKNYWINRDVDCMRAIWFGLPVEHFDQLTLNTAMAAFRFYNGGFMEYGADGKPVALDFETIVAKYAEHTQ